MLFRQTKRLISKFYTAFLKDELWYEIKLEEKTKAQNFLTTGFCVPTKLLQITITEQKFEIFS